MRLAFVNPKANSDPADSYRTAHPDFGGQLVYVREVALQLAAMGHQADILTRRVVDPEWPEFAAAEDCYPDQPNVRVLRFPCGPRRFLPKEELDRKSTRLNSSHANISYAVFCLKKKKIRHSHADR